MAAPDDDILNGKPEIDENGIDLSLIDCQLQMTPAQRLDELEEFVNFIVEAWEAQGRNFYAEERGLPL